MRPDAGTCLDENDELCNARRQRTDADSKGKMAAVRYLFPFT